jgi:hypothetical protein
MRGAALDSSSCPTCSADLTPRLDAAVASPAVTAIAHRVNAALETSRAPGLSRRVRRELSYQP